MKHLYRIAIIIVALTALPGCFSVTRVESELYTITQRDTTIRQNVRNAPGERDNGTIYPSPRSVEIDRRYVQLDSTVRRYYPAFLRFGGVETAGFLAPGASTDGGGNGLFGLYRLLTIKEKTDAKTFDSYMYRIMPYEIPLRAFHDAPDWTVGTAAYELFIYQRDNSAKVEKGEKLSGILPLYVRKRFFLHEKPPYVMVVPFLGVGILPSQYVNFGATFDVGSYGGFNLRAYAGYIAGSTLTQRDSNRASPNLNFPYFGIGVSALDFVNRNEELTVEWKDHKHSAIEVSALNVDLIYSNTISNDSVANDVLGDSTRGFPTGAMMKFASANFPLPVADGRFFVGTTLFNLYWLSKTEIAFGFLPIRAGYRFNLLDNDLNVEPFAEYTYYPGRAFQIGARASLKIYDWTQLEVVGGYINGSPGLDVVSGFEDLKGVGDFSTIYLGVGIGIGDVFHTFEEVNRK
jgi:hypothetical protein